MIPFSRPSSARRTSEYVSQALASDHLAGDGPFTVAASERLRLIVGSAAALLTTSGTHALELAALLLQLEPGDEVVMPSFNFPSAANAFALRGARPVFVDIRPDTLNVDEDLLRAAVGPRTKAIVLVHYAGVSCDMDTIGASAEQTGTPIVEDIAHSLFGRYGGRPSGSFGTLAAASFHETKNITCGEGGALFINDPALVARAEILREKGTNRTQFHRGEVDKYSWVDIGSSYLPSDVLAAMLLAQLDDLEVIQQRRARAWRFYRDHLDGWARGVGAQLPTVPPECEPSYHCFHLLLPDEGQRDKLIEHLRERGVYAVFHYVPLHLAAMGRSYGGRDGDLPVTEAVAARIVRLPLYSDITDVELEAVVAAVREFGA